jgi:hypothetical protein
MPSASVGVSVAVPPVPTVVLLGPAFVVPLCTSKSYSVRLVP